MAGKYRLLMWAVVTIGVLNAALFVALGLKISPLWYVGSVVLVPSILAAGWLRVRAHRERVGEELRQAWGTMVERDRDLHRIERDFRTRGDACGSMAQLDETTWFDLNMDTVFAYLDRTLTLPGEAMLYAMLRCPETTQTALQERKSLIRLFQDDSALCEHVLLELYRLGRPNYTDTAGLLWGRPAAKPAYVALLLPLTVLAVLAVFSVAFWGLSGLIFGVLPVFLVNFVITYWLVRARVYAQINALRYLGAMIGHAKRIAEMDHPALLNVTSELRTLTSRVRHISRRARLLRPEQGMSTGLSDVAFEYISSVFLIEARTFYGIQAHLSRHRASLRRIYDLMGTLDACQSVASVRQELPYYTEPEFAQERLACLETVDIYHPLLSGSVPNSFAPSSPGVFISGSNMSGKSTFLRCIAVNAILAQSIHTCCAKAYRASFFRILSSIDHADELEAGKSYYLIEAERLLHLVRSADNHGPHLCVVDELLKGTNAPERTSASAAILEYLCARNALVLVASHDTDLARTISDRIEHYHFTDRVEQGRLEFDYRLRKGVGTTRNATKILQELEYPREIVEAAQARLDELPQVY